MLAILAASENPLNFLTQFGVEWQMLVSQGLSFTIVAVALYWFVFKPVIASSEQRKQTIEQGLKDAEVAKQKLEQAQKETDKKLSEVAIQAAEILKQAQDTAKETIENATKQATLKANEIRERSQEQLLNDKERLKEELKSELSTLVADATLAVVGKVLTDKQRSELVNLAAQELKK